MNTCLSHHGILGMKWGVRRFQNKDGSLTPEGKRHEKARTMSDEELTTKTKRLNLENAYVKAHSEDTKSAKLNETKKLIDAAGRATKATNDLLSIKPTKVKMDLSHMTDQDMREQINRALLENQYNSIFGKEVQVSKGRQYASQALTVGGSILAVGSSALSVALAIKKLKKV